MILNTEKSGQKSCGVIFRKLGKSAKKGKGYSHILYGNRYGVNS